MAALAPGDPRRVGAYSLLSRLGGGGMGRVYLGRSPGGRLVAVKVIRPELAEDPEFRARFAAEVTAARKVNAAFTAPVIDADVNDDLPWIVTSYVAGPDLGRAVRERGPMSAGAMAALAAGLAEGLMAIHQAGVIHRDLKPQNVLLAQDGPHIIDFGIAKAAEGLTLTPRGMAVGSPGFMSPEQALGRSVGPASDMFSLGALLTFAVNGEGPFGTGVASALLYRAIHTKPDVSAVPSQLRALVTRCMDQDPERRPSAAEFLRGVTAAYPITDALTAWVRPLLSARPEGDTEPARPVPPRPAPLRPSAPGPSVPRPSDPRPPAPRPSDPRPSDPRPSDRRPEPPRPVLPVYRGSDRPRRRVPYVSIAAVAIVVIAAAALLGDHLLSSPRASGASAGSSHSAGASRSAGTSASGSASTSASASASARVSPSPTDGPAQPAKAVNFYKLSPGDCLTGKGLTLNTSFTWPLNVETVPCDQAHVGEVFYENLSQWKTTDAYPGYTAVQNQVNNVCQEAFRQYDGKQWSESTYQYASVAPFTKTGTTWESGPRSLTCVAYRSTTQSPNGAILTHSIKGTDK